MISHTRAPNPPGAGLSLHGCNFSNYDKIAFLRKSHGMASPTPAPPPATMATLFETHRSQ
jgi:hypothetical protein